MMEGVLGIIFGAALALVGGMVTLYVEKRLESRNREKEQADIASAVALSLLIKLVQVAGWSRMISRAIDECFAEASSWPSSTLEAGVKVKPFVMHRSSIEPLRDAELSLIMRASEHGILEQVLALQGNHYATFQLVLEFNEKRTQYSNVVRDSTVDGVLVDGLVAQTALPKSVSHKLEVWEGELNQLVAEMIASAAEDRKEAERLVVRLQTAFNSRSDLKVPRIEFLET